MENKSVFQFTVNVFMMDYTQNVTASFDGNYNIHAGDLMCVDQLSKGLDVDVWIVYLCLSSFAAGSIRSLTGTWIGLNIDLDDNTEFYRCEYQPPFTSKQNNLNGVQQVHSSNIITAF